MCFLLQVIILPVMGFDLGKIRTGQQGEPGWCSVRQNAPGNHRSVTRGGIVTLSWHPWNPATGENAWDPKGDAVAAVLDGGAQQQKFDCWLKKYQTSSFL